ncbi:phosphatase [Wenjunlia vitaminophila]|uniref:protein-serine/threonine phosphatase n=1 Tax=Wenjunlia vitaminophila TaxID=76728 RepID=A0A0T6LXE3_WENVI|nr:SpoIIE family protein phosphatase [Wenjunlia vitaminophila]KRV50399.1 phosphatase [Wenjunlia vitaminophila]
MHSDQDRAASEAERPRPPEPGRAEALASVDTGVVHWRHGTGQVELDPEAARLLGLPAEPTVLGTGQLRARLHPEDWVELWERAELAREEGSLVEVTLRVVAEDGRVEHVLQTRMRATGEGRVEELVGTLHEQYRPTRLEAAGAESRPPPAEEWRRAREAFLLDAGRALAEAKDTGDVLRVTKALSLPGLTPDGLVVYVREGDVLRVIGTSGYDPEDSWARESMRLDAGHPATEVTRTGRPVYVMTQEEYAERFPYAWNLVRKYDRHSWAILPLIAEGRTVGAWLAAFRAPARFTPDDRAVLTTIARMLGHALERTRLYESERAMADALQRAMLPVRAPQVPGMTVTGRYLPTGTLQVGGDWYDVIPLPNGRTAIVIGDVEGHDAHAAAVMGQLRIALRAYAAEGHRPDAVLTRAGRFLVGLETERFATCLYVEVNPESCELSLARAGHLHPAFRLHDGTSVVRPVPGGLPLGIDPHDEYPVSHLALEPGEVMLILTDGLLEAGGHDLVTGGQRILRVMSEPIGPSLEAMADRFINAVHGPGAWRERGRFSDQRQDDIAFVLLYRETGRAPAPARRTAMTISQAETNRIAYARAEIRATLYDWAVPDLVDTAVLLSCEMLTNVLVHTDSDAALSAELSGTRGHRRLRVEVTDRSDEMPRRRSPGELASSGRGLVLLDALSDAWGVEPRGEGKITWFELAEHRGTSDVALEELDDARLDGGPEPGGGAGEKEPLDAFGLDEEQDQPRGW